LATSAWAIAGSKAPHIVVDGRELESGHSPFIIEDRVFAEVRALVEALGADITWDADEQTVVISKSRRQGERYLQGLSNELPGNPDIKRNLISAAALQDLLDDDHDGDLADYRADHSGGDSIANDPLVLDLRARWLYDFGYIPSAVWVAEATAMGKQENEQQLRDLIAKHVAKGGKNEVVVYCSTGHVAGLVAGVLGSRGFNIKNLQYGFDVAWTGTLTVPITIKAPVEAKEAQGCG
jgi:rhodanese-related sulfurtransferase